MSSSLEHSGFSGQKPAKSPEKSTFSQTCSLLSQYLKEKGGFGDLTLGMTCNTNIEPNGSPETYCQSAATMNTMNLFPTKENNMTPQNLTMLNLLSQQAAYHRHLSAEEIQTLFNSSAPKSVGKEPKTAQMTIFYDGQVIVFDDFPADKAKEIMSFASKGNTQSQNNSAYTYTHSQPSSPPNLFINSADIPNVIPNTGTISIQEHPQAPLRPVVCDLPIARKASLHRFLEKRKDRIAAKAPYQTNNAMAASQKQAESLTWLGLGAKPAQI